MLRIATVVVLIALGLPTASHAGATPAHKCRAALYRAAGKRTACAYNANASAMTKAGAADYAACDAQYARTAARAYAKYGAACPGIDPDMLPMPPASTVSVARCTLTGEACASDGDCPAATVRGTCLDHGHCAYAPLDGTAVATSCTVNGGGTTALAESSACRALGDKSGCPVGTRCLFLNAPTCSSAEHPASGRVCGTQVACETNADCALTGANVCARCGDLVVQGNEDCEFDACASQCSPTCQFAGACLEIESLSCGAPCATDNDCGAPLGAFRCIPPTYCP